ncbi:MAG: hypothetical protein R2684_03895 [Pyrinomonadaceae bacterium]
MQIETDLLARQGGAVTNSEQRLPKPNSNLARESNKSLYRFEFLEPGDVSRVLAIAGTLVEQLTKALPENIPESRFADAFAAQLNTSPIYCILT